MANSEKNLYEFPKGFLWGAATSAIQVEGNVKDSDWWEWEQRVQPINFRSGLACDHYHKYKEDFALARKLGMNAQRIGLEWSRIEPKEGEFNEGEIQHYVDVIKTLKELGMSVCLTLHHFSNPLWFAQKGGWSSLKAPDYFERFVRKVAPELKDNVDLWVTINEPAVYIWGLYIGKCWPGAHNSNKDAVLTYWNLVQAHKKAYQVIHRAQPKAQVGIANNVTSFDVMHHHHLREVFSEWLGDITTNHLFYLLSSKSHDFLGINYYMNQYIGLKHDKLAPHLVDILESDKEVSDLGWEINPEGMFDILTDLADYKLPIYITENGIAAQHDEKRVRFLLAYLQQVYHAIKIGADVRGYFHWSLLDNMELHRGFDPRFGLIGVDFKTLERTPKPSALVYQKIAENNGIPHYLLKLLGHGFSAQDILKYLDS